MRRWLNYDNIALVLTHICSVSTYARPAAFAATILQYNDLVRQYATRKTWLENLEADFTGVDEIRMTVRQLQELREAIFEGCVGTGW
mgnify:CR=1 FL=1